MRIQSASLSISGNRQLPAMAAGHIVDHQIDATVQAEDVLLQQGAEYDPTASLGLETLLALMEGILEISTQHSITFSEALRTDTQLYDSGKTPPWLLAAQHSSALAQHAATRLHIEGTLTPVNHALQPFVLDMQLITPSLAGMATACSASFRLDARAGDYAGARVDFSLSNQSQKPLVSEASHTTPLLGTPLFAQFALGWQPDILCIAARLLPTVSANASQPHPKHAGDGGYVTQEDNSGSEHLVDVSA